MKTRFRNVQCADYVQADRDLLSSWSHEKVEMTLKVGNKIERC